MAAIPVFHGVVTKAGRLELLDVERVRRRVYLLGMAGKDVEIVIKVHRERRSTRQNRYYFGVVVPMLADHCGYEKAEMHELLAMKFLRIEDDPITGSPRRKHTPETETVEFAAYVDACIRLAAELDLVIPEPNEVAA